MSKKCKHRKLILMTANDIEFVPDQEPYKDGVIEITNIEIVRANINILYCPKCKIAHFDSIDDIWEIRN